MTSKLAPVPTREGERDGPSFPVAPIEEMLKLLGKAGRAQQLYLQNNPIYVRAIEQLRASFASIWEHTEEFTLTIGETEFRCEKEVVLADASRSSDSLPWLFYKDGIRELRILRGFEELEVVALLQLIQRVRKATPEEDDLLTLLWQADFLHLRYSFVDLAVDSAPAVDDTVSAEQRPEHVDPQAIVEEEEPEGTRPGVVNLDDFDATLYFLDETEIEYLREEVRKEYERDLRRNVLAIVYDVFEQQSDRAVRDEICETVDHFLLHLLSAGEFSAVAYALREAAAALDRVRDLDPAHRTKLQAFPDRLSSPEALSQLLQSLDEAVDLPPEKDLAELFGQLRGSALGTTLRWLPRLQNPSLRPLLEAAAARLASAHTAELVRLINSPDALVSGEAIRRAGALKTAAAAQPLAKILAEREPALRLLAVQALAEIGAPSALQALERAIEDAERDVRVAAARAIAARAYKPALARLEAVVKGKALRDADLTERMAMFEAFGTLCGDEGIPPLESILHGKGFLGRRENPELRACAAMALGRIGSPAALSILQRAGGEKEVLVRNAVNRALRGGQS